MEPKILLVDDSPFIHDVVTRLLAPDYLLTVAHDTAAMMQHLGQTRFDLTVLDLDLADGVRVPHILPNIKQHCGRVLIFSNTINQRDFDACLAGAVDGYLVKNQPIADLPRAIRAVLAGHQAFPQARLATYAQQGGTEAPHLSRSEAAVLAYLVMHPEASNPEIGNAVFLSTGRVANIMTNLFRLFHADSRNALVAAERVQAYLARQVTAADVNFG